MMQMNSFLSILKAEHYKTKRNIGLKLILLFPLFVTLFVDLYLAYKYVDVYQFAYNPWIAVLGRYIFSFYVFMYPLVIAIFCYSYCDIEYKHQSIKQLFTLPITKSKIYLAKSFLLIEVLLISILTAYFLFMLSGYVMSYAMPEYNYQNYDSRIIIGVFFFKLFIASIAIAFIQLFLSLTFNNFTIPIGFACFGVFFAIIANRWKYIDFIPYASINKGNSAFFLGSTRLIGNVELLNLMYILLFSFLCYWCFINLIKKKG